MTLKPFSLRMRSFGLSSLARNCAYLYSGDNLSAEYEPTFLATPTDFSSQSPYGNVGGAILKDHLWYFLSYNHDEVDDTYAPVEIEGFDTLEEGNIVNDSDTYFGKLSYSFNPNHNLSANNTLQDVAIEGLGAEAATPVARQTQEQENTRLRVNYQGIFSANSVLELKYGTMDRTIDTLPVGTIYAAQYEYVSYGIVDNNAWAAMLPNIILASMAGSSGRNNPSAMRSVGST